MPNNEELRELAVDPCDCSQCMGCVELAPDIFECDESTGMIRVKKDRVTEAEVREALASCPKDCIYFVE